MSASESFYCNTEQKAEMHEENKQKTMTGKLKDANILHKNYIPNNTLKPV